jgi:hypothetical protein
VPLCGNSIGTDRRFLARWYPEIEDYLHYRSVDVSTLKELARRWYPEVLTNAPKKRAATARSTTFARASTSCATTARNCFAADVTRPEPKVLGTAASNVAA